jgi:hypothetical protein
VAMFVVWPRWVSSRCVVLRWVSSCRGHDGCVTPHGVAVAVVALHGGVVVTVVAPHVVSRSQPSRRVVLWSWRVSSCHMVLLHHHRSR